MAFYVYMGLSDNGNAWGRLVIRYYGDDWLFLDKIIIKSDEKQFEIPANKAERDNNTEVWEWIDIPITASEYTIISNIASSQITKVRFSGKQYHKDRILTSSEIKGLRDALKYYDLLIERQILTK